MSRLDDTIRFQQTALSLRSARQEVIASNIANADTPNYKARDFKFADALNNALAGKSHTLPIAKTSEKHLAGNPLQQSILGSPLLYRTPYQASADGNTVEMDAERTKFTDNALRYEASVTFVSSKFKTLMSAIQGN